MFKKFILGSLLMAGLTACPIVDPIEPKPASPKAVDDPQTINPNTATSITIRPATNDIFDSSTSGLLSSIDLDASTGGQQLSYKDSTDKGTFSLDKSTGVVTFKPTAGKTGTAVARYTIKDTNGNVSNPANISVTISTVVPTGPIKVLFIGNSRTWYTPCTSGFTAYNIPTMVQSMSVNESRPLEVTVVTDCGFTLNQHWNTPGDAKAPVATKGWEYVVLQAATSETDTVAQSNTRSLIQQYKSAVIAANPNARVILYENWSLVNAPSDQPRLTAFYQLAADDVGAKIAPVGRAWRQGSFTELQLFNTDGEGKHATTLGAYISASTFYSLFYAKQAPITTGVPGTILASEASTARTNAFNAYSSMNTKYK